MRLFLAILGLSLLIGNAVAAPQKTAAAANAINASSESPSGEHALLAALADAPSADELRATITKLVGFGTRNTLSDTQSETRGIGAARRWVKSRFAEISKDCGAKFHRQTHSAADRSDGHRRDPARHGRAESYDHHHRPS